MSLKVYPTLPGLTYPVLRRINFDTLGDPAPNRYEVRLPQTVNPWREWQLIYDFVRDFPFGAFTITELATLEDFYMYHSGRAGDFLYLDPDDNFVGPAMVSGSPNVPLAQLALVNDGAGNYYSPLQRTRGGLFYEDITDLNTSGTGGSALAVYANGTLVTNYTVQGPGLALPTASYMGLYLQWAAAPTPPITAQFNFYFRAHFQSDAQDMEKFSNKFWTIGGSEARSGSGMIKLEQSRPVPL